MALPALLAGTALVPISRSALSWVSGSAARGGIAGFLAGIGLDDVPVVGSFIDPTEGGGGGLSTVDIALLLGVVFVGLFGLSFLLDGVDV